MKILQKLLKLFSPRKKEKPVNPMQFKIGDIVTCGLASDPGTLGRVEDTGFNGNGGTWYRVVWYDIKGDIDFGIYCNEDIILVNFYSDFLEKIKDRLNG